MEFGRTILRIAVCLVLSALPARSIDSGLQTCRLPAMVASSVLSYALLEEVAMGYPLGVRPRDPETLTVCADNIII
jgi:hypothetical protein